MSAYKLQDSFSSANVNSSLLLHRILCTDSFGHNCLWNNDTAKKNRNQPIVARTEHVKWDFYFSTEQVAELITYQNGNLPAKLVLTEAKPARLRKWSMLKWSIFCLAENSTDLSRQLIPTISFSSCMPWQYFAQQLLLTPIKVSFQKIRCYANKLLSST